ncbi:uncharacterized protein PRCAT00005334001 [Priceomyces carsonii]|uniref:uncharacterized protein n=1 Tax=Priceomyces carsonii TaxID=28549 RepID=UPI002EDA2980|nr:unnamed protein product [Priceomyces carsonii]
MSEYSSHTVAQLKDILKSKGLSTDGKKADLVERLVENDNNLANEKEEQPVEEEKKSEPSGEKEAEEEATLTVKQPEEKENEKPKEKPEPKVLGPEERKQLAVDLLTKKIQRAQKFGDEAAAEAARKDLVRIEKFGVEPGTAVAKEIGLVDKSFNKGLKSYGSNKNYKKNFKRPFKSYGKKFNGKHKY